MKSFRTNAAAITLIAIVLSSVALPLVASAQSYTTPSLPFWGPLVSCTGNYLPSSGATPCTSLCDLINTFINIVYFAITLALFAIAPIAFAGGGIMVMLSGANPEMLGSGKKVLISTVVGIVIVLCAYLIVSTLLHAFGVTVIGGFGGAGCTPD